MKLYTGGRTRSSELLNALVVVRGVAPARIGLAIARALDMKHAVPNKRVDSWRTGHMLPAPKYQLALFEVYGIPVDGWNVKHTAESDT